MVKINEGCSIVVRASERQWSQCVTIMTYAALRVMKDMESKDSDVAQMARELAPRLKDCSSLIDRISDALPKIIQR